MIYFYKNTPITTTSRGNRTFIVIPLITTSFAMMLINHIPHPMLSDSFIRNKTTFFETKTLAQFRVHLK